MGDRIARGADDILARADWLRDREKEYGPDEVGRAYEESEKIGDEWSRRPKISVPCPECDVPRLVMYEQDEDTGQISAQVIIYRCAHQAHGREDERCPVCQRKRWYFLSFGPSDPCRCEVKEETDLEHEVGDIFRDRVELSRARQDSRHE